MDEGGPLHPICPARRRYFIVSRRSEANSLNTSSMMALCFCTTGIFSTRRKLLVWDCYPVHQTAAVKEECHQRKTEMIFIPGGCTGIIQAPDVCWNKPFKGEHQNCTKLNASDLKFSKYICV